MDESASILWARVIRGINSMARKLTPRSASERAASRAVSGSPNPMSACPLRSSARSAAPVSGLAPRERTSTTTSADWNTSARLLAMRTPFSTYSESGNPARRPAPASIRNWVPVLLRTPIAPGTMATRRSPGDISETMPTVIPSMDLLECKHGIRIGGKKNGGLPIRRRLPACPTTPSAGPARRSNRRTRMNWRSRTPPARAGRGWELRPGRTGDRAR